MKQLVITCQEILDLEERMGKHKPVSEETVADKISKIPQRVFEPKEGEEPPK